MNKEKPKLNKAALDLIKHEINNPLTIILLQANRPWIDQAGGDEIEAQAKRIAEFVKTLGEYLE